MGPMLLPPKGSCEDERKWHLKGHTLSGDQQISLPFFSLSLIFPFSWAPLHFPSAPSYPIGPEDPREEAVMHFSSECGLLFQDYV